MRLVIFVLAVIPFGPVLAAEDSTGRKTGLWEIRTSFEGGDTSSVIFECVDRTSDALVRPITGAICSKTVDPRVNSFSIHTKCTFPDKIITWNATIAGNLDSAYKMIVEAAPGVPGWGHTTEGKWLRPCSDGQKAGDVITESAGAAQPP